MTFKSNAHFLLTNWKLYQISYTEGNTCHRCEFKNVLPESKNPKPCWEKLYGISMGRSKRNKKTCPIKWLMNDPILESYKLNAFIMEGSRVIDLSSMDIDDRDMSMYMKLYLDHVLKFSLSRSRHQLINVGDIVDGYARI